MSEFGQGFSYCLGLFLCHVGDIDKVSILSHSHLNLWFYGASDHLFGLETDHLPKELKQRADKFVGFCMARRLPTKQQVKLEDITWAIQEAKDILLAYDIHLNIPTTKAVYD